MFIPARVLKKETGLSGKKSELDWKNVTHSENKKNPKVRGMGHGLLFPGHLRK